MVATNGHVAASEKAGKLIVPLTGIWHVVAQEAAETGGKPSAKYTTAEGWRTHAEQLMKKQMELFEGSVGKSSKSEQEWVRTVAQQGTVTDKIAATTLLFQEGAAYRLQSLQTLLSMAQKKNKRETMLAVDAIKNIVMADILPDRKLKYFTDHKDWAAGVSDRLLLLRLFEDELKKFYLDFIKELEVMTHDTVPKTRRVALVHVYDLLCAKPEQEKNLLAILVDKLGDLDRGIAAKSSYLLSQLLVQHPNMKSVVVREVEALVFRPNVTMRARYYSLIMLNQIILTKADEQTANHLADTYFALYNQLVSNKKEEMDTKILSALLTGVNRAFPFSKLPDEVFEKHLDTLFKIVHQSSFNTGIQALLLLFQIVTTRQNAADRFYRTLYDVLLDRRLFGSSKQPLFLNLLYKAIKADTVVSRVKAFLKRVCQIAPYQQPTFACAVLIMISELVRVKPFLWQAIQQPEVVVSLDDDVEHFVDKDENDTVVEAGASSSASGPTSSKDAKDAYDPRKRDPKFCNADLSCFWELTELAGHYHPSVSKFAQSLLKTELIEYKGDPLADFTLANFLERFVYKNPKKDAGGIPARGSSIMQPNRHVRPHTDATPVFEESFTKKNVEDVPVDQVFFYNFFTEKRKIDDAVARKLAKRKAAKGSDQDFDAVEGMLTDDMIDDALGLSAEVMPDEDDEDVDNEDIQTVDEADEDGDDDNEEDDEAEEDAESGSRKKQRLPKVASKSVDDIDLDDDEAGYEDLEDALNAVDAEDAAMAATSRSALITQDLDDDEELEEVDDEDAMDTSADATEEMDADDDGEEEQEDAGEDEEEDNDGEEDGIEQEDDDDDEEDDAAFAKSLLDDEDDDEDDEDEDEDDEDEDEEPKGSSKAPLSKRAQKLQAQTNARASILKGINLDGSTFASAEDFAHLLESSGSTSVGSKRQSQWEDRGKYGKRQGGYGKGRSNGPSAKRARR